MKKKIKIKIGNPQAYPWASQCGPSLAFLARLECRLKQVGPCGPRPAQAEPTRFTPLGVVPSMKNQNRESFAQSANEALILHLLIHFLEILS